MNVPTETRASQQAYQGAAAPSRRLDPLACRESTIQLIDVRQGLEHLGGRPAPGVAIKQAIPFEAALGKPYDAAAVTIALRGHPGKQRRQGPRRPLVSMGEQLKARPVTDEFPGQARVIGDCHRTDGLEFEC